jgi:hypothetical protein
MHPSTFQYLKPSAQQLKLMEHLREEVAHLYAEIDKHMPEGRYKSLAITKLEECAMFVNKGITREGDGTPREGASVE